MNRLIQGILTSLFASVLSIQPISTKISDDTLMKQLKEEHQSVVYGFYVNWDKSSKDSLERNISAIDVVVPEWYHLVKNGMIQDESDKQIATFVEENQRTVMPLINNFNNGSWDGALLHQLFTSEDDTQRVIEELLQKVKENGYSGINIDFESVDITDKDNLTNFMTSLSSAFHKNGLLVTQDVPADDDAFNYEALSKVVDKMIVMSYDEHYSTSKPGPVASDDWVRDTLNNLDIPDNKLIVSLGNYGYDWIDSSKKEAAALSFSEIMQMAFASHLQIQWSNTAKNPYIRYKENGEQHTIWFLDAATFYNQLKIAEENGASGVALWRLGSEDLVIWDYITKAEKNRQPQKALERILNSDPVHYTGEGEILQTASASKKGTRKIIMDADGNIKKEEFFIHDRAVFTMIHGWGQGISLLFYSALLIGVIRLISFMYLSRKQKKKN